MADKEREQYLKTMAELSATVTKSSGISPSAQLVTYGDPNLQDVIVGVAKPEDIVTSFSVPNWLSLMFILPELERPENTDFSVLSDFTKTA